MKKLNRSFARRIGKTLSNTQKSIIDEMMETHILRPEEITKAVAEIGIGMGEHFINQAKNNPDIIHIGFEPYLNGIANTLIMAKEQDITNIRLWPDDMDLVFSKLPGNCLERIYVLFPDPWPKTSHKKRRIICTERLELFAQKLAKDGNLFFASDIEDYSAQTEKLIDESDLFELVKNASNLPHEGYIQTKYHSKAISEGRIARFASGQSKKTCKETPPIV